MSTLKTFADDNLNVAEIMDLVSDRVETFWEKQKILVTSIFSFSRNIFKRFYFKFINTHTVWYTKGLTLSQTSPVFNVSAVQVV